MPTLKALTDHIRIYSSLNPASSIIHAAEKNNLQVYLGMWLGTVPANNEAEITAGEALVSTSSAVQVVIVGNEVLLRGDLTEDQLHTYLQRVRSDFARLGKTVQITMADTADEWLMHPKLAQDVDFITAHIYPFWVGVPIDCAIQAVDQTYSRLLATFPGKKIVIGETGWPSDSSPQPESLPRLPLCTSQAQSTPAPAASATPEAGTLPSPDNQYRYLLDFTAWAQQKQVEYFYFDAFDEDWKVHEHGVGTHWGLYQQDGQLKPLLSGWLPTADPGTLAQRAYFDVAVGGLESGFDMGIDTSNHIFQWLTFQAGIFTLNYPAGQQWGTAFITACKAVPPAQRTVSIDLSAYRSLVFDMRATVNGACVQVGIKDRYQPDDGTEAKTDQCLTTQWTTYMRPLSVYSATLTSVYTAFEVIFKGGAGFTIQLSNVRYSPT
jgi:exo-beta-1,3-glucanase (GH17 family)